MLSILGLFRTPSAATLAQRELEEAERTLLAHKSNAEHYVAMVKMLTARVDRLHADLTRLTAPAPSPTE